MSTTPPTPDEILRPLRRTRQFREFEPTPLDRATIDALLDVARWTGSGSNSQPWRFLVLTDRSTLDRVRDAGLPQTRGLTTAPAAIAIAVPSDPGSAISNAYDEGRAAERLLVGATMLGLGAGISWIRSDVRPAIAEVLGIPDAWIVRTIVQLGHPTEAARAPKSAPGEARLPRDQVVFEGRWPSE
jgi:nitroreductase